MTIPEAFLKVADAAVQTGCARVFVNVLRSMDYRISGPSGDDGLLDEDELLTVSPEHMCIVGGLMIGGFYGPTSGVKARVPVDAADKLMRGMDRIERGQPADGVSDSALEADMNENIDLI